MLHFKLLGLKHGSDAFHQLTAKFGRRWVECVYVLVMCVCVCVRVQVDELLVHLLHINYGIYWNAVCCSFQADTQRSPHFTRSLIHTIQSSFATTRTGKQGLPLILPPPPFCALLSTCREYAPNFMSTNSHCDSGALQKLTLQQSTRRPSSKR